MLFEVFYIIQNNFKNLYIYVNYSFSKLSLLKFEKNGLRLTNEKVDIKFSIELTAGRHEIT